MLEYSLLIGYIEYWIIIIKLGIRVIIIIRWRIIIITLNIYTLNLIISWRKSNNQ